MKDKEESLAATIGLLLVGLLASLLFGIIAYMGGARPIADAVRTGWRASSLVEVPAKVVGVQLEHTNYKSGAPSPRKSLRAQYQYEWRGVRYQGSQVSLQARPDTFSESPWNDVWFEKLERARKTGETVPAWIHPSDAHDAVLDKDPRYEGLWVAVLILSFGIVPLLFVGLALFFVVMRKRNW